MRHITWRRVVVATGLATALSLAPGCEFTKAGKAGNLAFTYQAEEQLVPPSFGAPLGQGLRANVLVTNADTKEPATVSSARSSDDGVLKVPSKSGDRLTIEGVAAGKAELQVTAGGLDDAVDIEVQPIDKVVLKYPAALLASVEPPVAVVKGGDASFPMTLFGPGESALARKALFGYGPVPVTIQPEGAAQQVTDTEDPAHAVFRFMTTGSVKLLPKGGDPAELEVQVVEATDVATLNVKALGTSASGVKVGSEGGVSVSAETTDGVSVVGLANLVTVQGAPAETCSVRALPMWGDGVFGVKGLAAGTCTISVTMGDKAAELTVEIQ